MVGAGLHGLTSLPDEMRRLQLRAIAGLCLLPALRPAATGTLRDVRLSLRARFRVLSQLRRRPGTQGGNARPGRHRADTG
jgi:hypothetical protein